MDETMELEVEEELEVPAAEPAEDEAEAVTEQDEPVEMEEKETEQTAFADTAAHWKGGEEHFRQQARELVTAFPELRGRQAPAEVIRAAVRGENLTAAYARHALAQSRADNARLERELAAERQNAAAALRAPVRGVSGGAAVGEQGRDPFLTGLMAD